MPKARLIDIRLDEDTWAGGSRERQHEWSLALRELLIEHVFDAPWCELKLLVTQRDERTHIAARSGDDTEVAAIDIPRAQIAPLLAEYLDICRQMARLGHVHTARYEALDVAKRLTHDEAAELLGSLCRVLGPDLGTCRRLFTLLVTLHIDTTRFIVPHHRRPR